jgi:quercetin dioxygenase-like cupin family protein
MLSPGTTIISPTSGEEITFATLGHDSGGALLAFHLRMRPGGRVSTPHQHPRREERVTVTGGAALVELGSQRRVLRPGDVLVIPAGTPHRIAHLDEEDDALEALVEFRPAGAVAEFLDEVFALDRAGRTKPDGQLSLLQAAVTVHGRFDDMALTTPALPVQKALLNTLAPIARLIGYRNHYAERTSAVGRAGG